MSSNISIQCCKFPSNLCFCCCTQYLMLYSYFYVEVAFNRFSFLLIFCHSIMFCDGYRAWDLLQFLILKFGFFKQFWKILTHYFLLKYCLYPILFLRFFLEWPFFLEFEFKYLFNFLLYLPFLLMLDLHFSNTCFSVLHFEWFICIFSCTNLPLGCV